MQQVGFGGGWISPAVKAHLQKQPATPVETNPKTAFGGGWIAPAVKAHLQKKQVASGGGWISPSVKAHLVKHF